MNTTIAISTNTRDQLQEFGNKGETYEEILKKLIESAKQRQLQELLFDESDSVTVRDALERAKNRWQK